jgi:hypothetical protein
MKHQTLIDQVCHWKSKEPKQPVCQSLMFFHEQQVLLQLLVISGESILPRSCRVCGTPVLDVLHVLLYACHVMAAPLVCNTMPSHRGELHSSAPSFI